LPRGQLICTALLRMSRSNNEWCAQSRQLVFQLDDHGHEMIQSQFKHIRWFAHSDGKIQAGARHDDAHEARTRAVVGRAASGHICKSGVMFADLGYRRGAYRKSILSTYLARMSNSRFNKSPIWA